MSSEAERSSIFHNVTITHDAPAARKARDRPVNGSRFQSNRTESFSGPKIIFEKKRASVHIVVIALVRFTIEAMQWQ